MKYAQWLSKWRFLQLHFFVYYHSAPFLRLLFYFPFSFLRSILGVAPGASVLVPLMALIVSTLLSLAAEKA